MDGELGRSHCLLPFDVPAGLKARRSCGRFPFAPLATARQAWPHLAAVGAAFRATTLCLTVRTCAWSFPRRQNAAEFGSVNAPSFQWSDFAANFLICATD